MEDAGRYKVFINFLFVIEDILILNGAYAGLLYVLGLRYDGDYPLLQLVINMGYLLSVAVTRLDLRKMLTRKIIARNFYRLSVTTVIFLGSIFLLQIGDVSRTFIILFFTLLFILLCAAHLLTRRVLSYTLNNSRTHCNAVILGAGATGRRVWTELSNNIYSGVRVLGFFDDNATGADILGNLSQAKDYAVANDVVKIYCSLPLPDEQIRDLMTFSEDNIINLYIIPPVEYAFSSTITTSEPIGNLPVFTIHRTPLENFHNIIIKRLFDLVFSALFLVTLFPVLYLIFGLLIKLSSPGPVFFKQNRTGKNGKTFKCYKFRSMRQNKEADTKQATAHDERKTRIGEFMRKTNIDELPQFINVFKGEMSMVGPRPHMLSHTEEYSKLVDKYMVRHFIKPGVTGWAQITGFRGETQTVDQMEQRIKRDIWYLENWSAWLDLEIIARTVFVTFKGDPKAR
jgi:putative colanic acid biosynthesis UDP-glucose lipid carrier transferase